MYQAEFLARLESALRGALPLWGMGDGTDLRLLTISENATYLATDKATGARTVFRVHRPDYHTRDEIVSELAWIESLRATGDLAIPAPIPKLDGTLIADIDDDGHTRHVVAFEFVAGTEPPDGNLLSWYRELGAIHARLHAHSIAWAKPPGFTRFTWDFETTIGDTPHWGDWRKGPGLTAETTAIVQQAVDIIRERLSAYGKDNARYGLIHADLRLANLLVDGDRLTLIDFDDCGMSWYLYDFATAISFIEIDPRVPELLAAWKEGYRSVRPLSEEEAAIIPTFIMMRRIQLTAWIASHAETPTAQSMGEPYVAGTVEMARRFLAEASGKAQA